MVSQICKGCQLPASLCPCDYWRQRLQRMTNFDNNAQHGIIFNDKFYKLIDGKSDEELDGKSDEECCEKCALEEECWSVRQERQVLLCVVFSEAIGRSPKGCYFKEGMIIQKE